MFKFTRKGPQVVLEIARFCFNYDGSSESEAQLVLNAIESYIEDRLKTTRQDFYDWGYKDGKAKRKKCDWIGGGW
ncbi:hypothetical protein LCGC14_0836820 [marine sediment metagenome]|uniref:Uncharacterized protein n=1 Tax=marine sediment metagenome TaxID=412755 RepID=A0A0F9SLL9_9ZZZZ